MKQLIISADDFGLDTAINEAVERAHRDGILTSASLMVGEGAADDAVARARLIPSLKVGLHVTLVEGRPISTPAEVPDLVTSEGRFRENMVASGFRYFFLPHVRRQLAHEIEAQFRAFAMTGLPLDHVNAHKHFHLHPTIARLIIHFARLYGAKAIRLPREPVIRAIPDDVVEPRENFGARALRWWTGQLAATIRRSGLLANDHVYGLRFSGGMTEQRVSSLIPQLPDGVTEIYFHPAVRRTSKLEKAMPDYKHVDEYRALISPGLRQALDGAGIIRTSFTDLALTGKSS